MFEYTRPKIEKWFTHAAHTVAQGAALTAIHDGMRATALQIFDELPEGPEKKLALDSLQEAAMWATAAISRHGVITPPVNAT